MDSLMENMNSHSKKFRRFAATDLTSVLRDLLTKLSPPHWVSRLSSRYNVLRGPKLAKTAYCWSSKRWYMDQWTVISHAVLSSCRTKRLAWEYWSYSSPLHWTGGMTFSKLHIYQVGNSSVRKSNPFSTCSAILTGLSQQPKIVTESDYKSWMTRVDLGKSLCTNMIWYRLGTTAIAPLYLFGGTWYFYDSCLGISNYKVFTNILGTGL